MIRSALISACDAFIITMMLAVGLLYVFRWPLVVFAVASMAVKVMT